MAKREVWVGIDVSKRRLDVALGVHGELLQVDNDPGGFTVPLEKLGALGPDWCVVFHAGEIPGADRFGLEMDWRKAQ